MSNRLYVVNIEKKNNKIFIKRKGKNGKDMKSWWAWVSFIFTHKVYLA